MIRNNSVKINKIFSIDSEKIVLSVTDIDVDEEENIYILDEEANNIKIFNKYGKCVKTFGRKGQGPGEFLYPWSIHYNPYNGYILINDFMSKALISFNKNGQFMEKLENFHLGQIEKLSITKNGNILCLAKRSSTYNKDALILLSSDMKIKKEISYFIKKKLPILESITSKFHFAIDEQNQLIWGHSSENVINIQSMDGNIKRIIHNEYRKIKIDRNEYKAEIKRKFGGRIIPDEFESELPKYYPAFKKILYYKKRKMIFIETYETNLNKHCYQIFNNIGQFYKKVFLPFKLSIIKNGKFYSIENNEEGYDIINIYEVIF